MEAVTHLTDANFKAVALDPARHVLVAFVAPWCGHCKSLKPEFAKLAATFLQEDKVVVAQVDATANEIGGDYGVKGFPTIKVSLSFSLSFSLSLFLFLLLLLFVCPQLSYFPKVLPGRPHRRCRDHS